MFTAADTVTNRIQISNFKYLDIKIKSGSMSKRLRFTLVITFGDPEIAITADGCLAMVDTKGELKWSPPLSRMPFGASLKTVLVNQELYDRVLAALASTEYVAGLRPESWDDRTGVICGAAPVDV